MFSFSRRSFFFRFLVLRCSFSVFFLPFFEIKQAFAFDPSSMGGSSSKMATAVESLIQFKAQSSGALTVAESAAMPEALGSALTSWGAAEAAAEGLALATPVGWVGLAAGVGLAAAAAGTKYCIDNGCSLSWLSSPSNKVSLPAVQSSTVISPSTGYWYFAASDTDPAGRLASTANDAAALYLMAVSDKTNPYYLGYNFQGAPTLVRISSSMATYSVNWLNSSGYTKTLTFSVNHVDTSSTCSSPVVSTMSQCSTTKTPVVIPSTFIPASSPMTYQEANAETDIQYGKASLSPDVLTDVANEAWRRAAAQQGYKGLPYSSQITSDDVSAWLKAGHSMPSVADAVSAVGNLSGTASQPSLSSPVTFPVPDSSTGLLPSDSSSGSGSSSEVCGSASNPCHVDWGSKSDLSVPDPDVSQTGFLKPFFNFLPIQSHSFSIPSGSCQIPDFPATYYTPAVSMQSKCDLLAKVGPIVTPFADVVWSLSAMFILLSA